MSGHLCCFKSLHHCYSSLSGSCFIFLTALVHFCKDVTLIWFPQRCTLIHSDFVVYFSDDFERIRSNSFRELNKINFRTAVNRCVQEQKQKSAAEQCLFRGNLLILLQCDSFHHDCKKYDAWLNLFNRIPTIKPVERSTQNYGLFYAYVRACVRACLPAYGGQCE